MEKFSPYMVNIFDVWGFGFARAARADVWCFGISAALSGGRYFTTPGKGVTGFDGIGNEPVCEAFWLSNRTGGT